MKKTLTAAVFAAATLQASAPAAAGIEPFIGEIMMFGGNFCPRGWARADGQLLAIAPNTALFSIYGATYGGDGRETFGLPDLRGRAPIHNGSGAGLENRAIGQIGGQQSTSLNAGNVPAHSHPLVVQQSPPDSPTGAGNFIAGVDPGNDVFAAPNAGASQQVLAPGSIGSAGNGQAFGIESPYQVITMCVSLFGIFPSRN